MISQRPHERRHPWGAAEAWAGGQGGGHWSELEHLLGTLDEAGPEWSFGKVPASTRAEPMAGEQGGQ